MDEVESLTAEYQQITERRLRGGHLDAEVDRLLDRQEAIVRRLRSLDLSVRELIVAPWIEVRAR